MIEILSADIFDLVGDFLCDGFLAGLFCAPPNLDFWSTINALWFLTYKLTYFFNISYFSCFDMIFGMSFSISTNGLTNPNSTLLIISSFCNW